MPLLMSQKSLRCNSSSSSVKECSSSVKECSSRINPKRHINDVNRNSSTSSNYKNKNDIKNNNMSIERNNEGDYPGGTKKQKIVPLVSDEGVDCPVSKNPITPTLLDNIEDGELSD